MRKFQDKVLKSVGVTEDMLDAEAIKAEAERLQHKGQSMMKAGCGLTIASLLVLILIALI